MDTRARAAQRNAAALLSSSVTRLSVGSTVRSCPLTLAIQLVPWGYRRDAGRSASLGTQSRLVHGICCIERRAVSGQEQYFPCPRSKSTAHDHRSSGPPPLLLRSGEAMGPGEGEALAAVGSALEPLMPQHNDLSRSLLGLDQAST